MPAFPRELAEIKAHRQEHRRPKPSEGETGDLGSFFKLAQKQELPHVHNLNNQSAPPNLIKGKKALDEIFKWILSETAERLDQVNQGIALFNANNDQTLYDTATKAFADFVSSLNDPTPAPGGSGAFGPTINAATIDPIQNAGGYCTSAKVIVQWLGGTHSDSSMIHVP
jgi:hypothetical protein